MTTDSIHKIAGYQKEKQQIAELQNMLLHLKDYEDSGIRIPRGVLLYGVPGVGKTQLAKSVICEGIASVELCAADCVGADTGEKIQTAFGKAKEKVPCVLIVDELDKIAETSPHYHMEANSNVMKILLQELDKKDLAGVLVVATCNDYRMLNEALLRAGRFDRMMEILPPSPGDREEIIRYYLSGLNMPMELDIGFFAKITGTFTGAQLECIVNEAAIYAMNNGKAITMDAVQTVIDRMVFKDVEDMTKLDRRRKQVAIHEAGHAVIALVLNPEKVNGISMVPAGHSMGRVRVIPEDVEPSTVSEYEDEITALLGGMAAEDIFTKNRSTGVTDDMNKVSRIVVTLVTKLATAGFGCFRCNFYDGPAWESEAKTQRIEDAETKIMERCYQRAVDLLNENRPLAEAIYERLLVQYSMTRDEMMDLKDKWCVQN